MDLLNELRHRYRGYTQLPFVITNLFFLSIRCHIFQRQSFHLHLNIVLIVYCAKERI